MQDLYGTYRGFTFTDESGLGVGEMCIVIDSEKFTSTVATGLGIEQDSVDASQMREMTADEIAADFNEDFDTTGIRGIISADATPDTVTDYTRLLFLPAYKGTGEQMEDGEIDEDTDESILVRGMFGEAIFGPSVLFHPRQTRAGMFDTTIALIEDQAKLPGAIPRIDNGGRAPRDTQAAATSS